MAQVGFSYTEAEMGHNKLLALRTELEEFISQLESLKVQNPDDWNGQEEATYQSLMVQARNGLDVVNENIAKIDKWLNYASAAHKSNESANSNLLSNAYAHCQL